MKRFWLSLVAFFAFAVSATAADHPLRWDATTKEARPKFEDGVVKFEFTVTNTSRQPVRIYYVQASCACTTVEAPPMPWTLAAGERGVVKATVDFRGKESELAKDLLVGSVPGTQTLKMVVHVPAMTPEMRLQNQQIASANRQKVFEGDCAACHATPAKGRFGDDLFEAACTICHDPKHRAAMVPDLTIAKEKRDAAWWKRWVEDGRDGSLMPGFAEKHGGPLTDPQIESLVEYLMRAFPAEPKPN